MRSDNKPLSHKALAKLALGALGVVYGDIGTSPLYALKTVFDPTTGIAFNYDNLMGVVSLVIWSLIVVVSLKYVTLILRADNRGEGGIMALLALASSFLSARSRWRNSLIVIGIFGAALFYGDGVITPAISVLSAVEGLSVATSVFTPYVIPITLVVLVALFIAQSKGTTVIGHVFGPVMVVWFLVIGLVGLLQIIAHPAVLHALNPIYGLHFLLERRWIAFVALGSVVLALTGAEALYADLGHFGARPIRLAWTALVFPTLVANYLGQGALMLADPATLTNPFYLMFPSWALYPMVALATLATVIASQAVISGTYSMTKQAIQLGFMPRMRVIITSSHEAGQIYVPVINWCLLVAVIAAVLGFGSSDRLGAAYGVAVTGTMAITTLLTFFVVRNGWHYNILLATIATIGFFTIDITFFAANLLKIVEGGWFPILIGIGMFTVMATWRHGRLLLIERTRADTIPIHEFLSSLFIAPPIRIPGTAVFLSRDAQIIPSAFMHNLSHNKVLHEYVVFVTVSVEEVPIISPQHQARLADLGNGCYQLTLRYGFKNDANLPQALERAATAELPFDPMSTSYFVSRENLVCGKKGEMARWRKQFFITMFRNAGDTAEFFSIPPNRLIELGAQVEL